MSEEIIANDVAQDTATVLLHVALADGRADEQELARIQRVVVHQAKLRGVEATAIDLGSVSEESFTAAVKRLAPLSKPFKSDVLNYAAVIAQVDDDIEASEVAIINKISSGFFEGDDVLTAVQLALAKQAVSKAEDKLGFYSCEEV
jgi:uncharacterized tellurite resistance protein B-like protein